MSEPKRNILPVVDEPEGKPRQRARTMSRKEMARLFRQQAAAGGLDPELQTFMAELDATRPRSRGDCAEGEIRKAEPGHAPPASPRATSM